MNPNRGRAWTWFAIYRGQVGQWAQLLHRLTGLGIVGFLLLHIADTSLVGWGPGVYDVVTTIYHNPFVRALEIVLVGVVIYHAINGLRVTVIDFWDKGSLYQERLYWATIAIFLVLFIPSAVLMVLNSY